jgi:hypothetical protein
MLIIRDKQIKVFEDESDRRFVTEVLHGLKADLPDEFISADEEAEMIDSGVKSLATAKQYELEDNNSLANFVTMSWLYGDDFHTVPETNKILKDESISKRLRMSEVMKSNKSDQE